MTYFQVHLKLCNIIIFEYETRNSRSVTKLQYRCLSHRICHHQHDMFQACGNFALWIDKDLSHYPQQL